MQRVVDTIWFTNRDGTIGIVIAEDDQTLERRAFIGRGQGASPVSDVGMILDWGSTFSPAYADTILRLLKKEDKPAQPQEQFRVVPHKELPGKHMVEYWEGEKFIAGIYPHKDGIRVVSKYYTGIMHDPNQPPAVVVKLHGSDIKPKG